MLTQFINYQIDEVGNLLPREAFLGFFGSMVFTESTIETEVRLSLLAQFINYQVDEVGNLLEIFDNTEPEIGTGNNSKHDKGHYKTCHVDPRGKVADKVGSDKRQVDGRDFHQ